MTSSSDEKWRPFNCFFSRVGLRTYQHPCTSRNVHIRKKLGQYALTHNTRKIKHFDFNSVIIGLKWTRKSCESRRYSFSKSGDAKDWASNWTFNSHARHMNTDNWWNDKAEAQVLGKKVSSSSSFPPKIWNIFLWAKIGDFAVKKFRGLSGLIQDKPEYQIKQ